MKLKQLLVAVLLTVSAGASAQTDVTSTYLTNADFSQGTPVTVGVCTYAKDKATNGTDYANLVAVDGWTAVSSADGKAGGLFAIGGGAWLGGKGFTAPATDSDGNTGVNVLGIVTCWGASVQYTQDLKAALPAGTYTLVLAAYNSGAGQNDISANLIGFKEAGGTTHYATTKKYTSNTWKYEFITFTLSAETSGQVSIGYTGAGSSSNLPHLFVSGLQLFEGTVDAAAYEAAKTAAREAKEAKVFWDNAVAAANAALNDAAYANVIGSERGAVEVELAKTEPTTKDGYNEATAALTTATNAFTAAKASYDALVSEIAYAKTIAVATADAKAALNADADATSVVTATQALKVLEYTTINSAYANDVTSLLGTWGKGNYDTTSGQGYVGSESYFDKWNGSATDLTSSATVTLPAGKYVVKVAGRGVSTTTMNLSVKVGDADAVSTPFLMIGDTGKGIDTDGVTNFSEEGTYSNNNTGRGWQYRYIVFTTDGNADVTIAINGHLNAGTWQSFYAPVLLCDDDTYSTVSLIAAKAELQATIDAAPAVRTANIGDGVFQIAEAGVNTYAAAVEAANAALADGAATLESLATAKSTFEAAVAAYNALEVNAPADGQLFNVVLTFAGWDYDQKAMTYLANNRTDAGLYNIQYKEAANTNLAQAFTFTKVEGNKYKMSQIDADGVVRYISTGVTYGGNTNQIRTVTEADKALLVEVIPTNVEGVYNLRNTEANNYIGSQDAGVFTVNSHIDFKLVETTKPSITVNTTAAGWGTVMLPFAVASLPEGVKAYTCAADAVGEDGSTLTLTEAAALEANKPYIIKGAWSETLTGDAQGTALTATEGLLTGVYTDTPAIVDTYVLQNQSGVVGFYQVETAGITTVKANRAYLTAPATQAGVKAFFLGGVEDAIQSVFESVATGEVYNIAGQRISKLQRGVNIVNGKKVLVK